MFLVSTHCHWHLLLLFFLWFFFQSRISSKRDSCQFMKSNKKKELFFLKKSFFLKEARKTWHFLQSHSKYLTLKEIKSTLSDRNVGLCKWDRVWDVCLLAICVHQTKVKYYIRKVLYICAGVLSCNWSLFFLRPFETLVVEELKDWLTWRDLECLNVGARETEDFVQYSWTWDRMEKSESESWSCHEIKWGFWVSKWDLGCFVFLIHYDIAKLYLFWCWTTCGGATEWT